MALITMEAAQTHVNLLGQNASLFITVCSGTVTGYTSL